MNHHELLEPCIWEFIWRHQCGPSLDMQVTAMLQAFGEWHQEVLRDISSSAWEQQASEVVAGLSSASSAADQMSLTIRH